MVRWLVCTNEQVYRGTMEGADAVALSREAEAGLRLVAKGLSDAALTELARGVFAVLGRAGGVTEDTILGKNGNAASWGESVPRTHATALHGSLRGRGTGGAAAMGCNARTDTLPAVSLARRFIVTLRHTEGRRQSSLLLLEYLRGRVCANRSDR